MRTTLFFLLMLSSLIAPAQSDTLYGHSGATILMDSPPPCFPITDCPAEACHTLAIADTGMITLTFGSIGATFNIAVLQDDHLLLYSSCAWIDQSVPSFSLDMQFPVNSSVMACGWPGDSLYIFYKAVPLQSYPPFEPPFIDLDTLCDTLVSVTPSAGEPTGEYYYIDPYTFIRTLPRDMKPEHYYLKRRR